MNGTIEKRVYIQASPETIFRALTDSRDLVEWFCDKAETEPSAGGELHVQWRNGRRVQKGHGVFESLVPGAEVVIEWRDDGNGPDGKPPRHTLSFSIRGGKSNVEVRVKDEGQQFPDDETRDRVSDGWNSVLLELKEHCEERQRATRLRQSYGAMALDEE
jgi:uncharacterized protein YndB with AHSA1/START domain